MKRVARSFGTLSAVGWLVGAWQMAVAQPTRPIGYLQEYLSPRIARCLIERDPEIIGQWLRLLPGSRDEMRLFRKANVRFSACFDRSFRIHDGLQPEYDIVGMRAGLIRARLQAARDRFPAQRPAGDDRTAWYAKSEDPSDPLLGPAIQTAEIGACLARKHWVSVVKLVTVTDPAIDRMDMGYGDFGRPESKAAQTAVREVLGDVVPSIAGCVPSGVTVRLDAERLRALLEEAAYHMAIDTGSGAAG